MKRWFKPTSLKRTIFFLCIDFILSLVTLYLAYLLRFNFYIPHKYLDSFWLVFLVLSGLKLSALFFFRNYFIIWRFFSFSDAKNIVKAHVVAYGLFIIIYIAFQNFFIPFPRSVIVIDFFLSLIFIGVVRISKRLLLEGRNQQPLKPVLLLGISSKTATMIQSALKGEIDYYPVAIFSLKEDKSMRDTYINNVKVYDISSLETVVSQKNIVSAIITEAVPSKVLKILFERLNALGVTEIKQVKLLGAQHEKLEDLTIEDLLARHPKDLDLGIISEFIQNKTVLITGAGGSIGSEIARQCYKFGASSLVLVDNCEYNLYQIGEQIGSADLRLLTVTDQAALLKLFKEVSPQIVIHAAAYKHVPLCESNQDVAVYNNVLGTKNVIDSSISANVHKVVIISTDKAVRPTNIMGATKRVTELYAQNIQSIQTEIVAVRFGNVLGSSGSVIPKFKMQIEQGGPITVTHPEITRYFMLISEACQLVLQTAAIAKGGELFILDMGEPIKIVELAKQMIKLYGKEEEVEIVFTGLRPGEKLYEELLLDESEHKTKFSSIFIAKPTHYDIQKLNSDILELLQAEDKVKILKKIIPEFIRKT
jgi:UDP-N-acetyl-D-glucosamine 4,6-dehydratase